MYSVDPHAGASMLGKNGRTRQVNDCVEELLALSVRDRQQRGIRPGDGRLCGSARRHSRSLSDVMHDTRASSSLRRCDKPAKSARLEP